jgi:hypothetical protein
LFVRSLVGTLALLVAFVPLVMASTALRRRLLPGWSGPPGWLAQLVAVITVSLSASIVLGTVGWFSLVPTTVLLSTIGIASYWLASRLQTRELEPPEHPPERLGRYAKITATVAVAFVAATWGARAYVALSHGMVSIDSLWYHLPQAARFASEHSITSIHHDVADLSGFYPINAELMHGLGMVLLGNDFLSMVLTVGWGAMALFAAWCIGRPFGMAAVCLTGVAVLLCVPAFVGTQPGAAHNDIVGVTLVLSTAALLITAGPTRLTRDPVVLALAAMPIGFAVGTKWTLVPIAAAMTVGVLVLLPRGARLRLSVMWLAIVGLLGSFSYVRNLVRVGSPLPNVDLTLGPLGWERQAPEIPGMTNVAGFLFDGAAWRDWLLPGLSRWFGYAWWAVLALMVVGLLVAIATGPGPVVRMLGVVGVVAFVAYLVQPQLLTLYGQPYYFAANIRYVTAAMALGLTLLPLSRGVQGRHVRWVVPLLYVAVIGVMQFDSAVWPVELRELRWEEPVRGADAIAGLVAGVVTLAVGLVCVFYGSSLRSRVTSRAGSEQQDRVVGRRRWSLGLTALAVAALCAIVLGIVGSQGWYLDHRYTRPEAATPFVPEHWRTWEWARDTHDERIGFNAPSLSYPLYGNRLTNLVEELPNRGALRANDPTEARGRCERFHRAVNGRRYSYVVLFGSLGPVADPDAVDVSFEELIPEVAWLDADPSATRVLDSPFEAVFRIDGPLDDSKCSAAAGSDR